jgi:Uma2 family endonuclease
MNGVREYWLVDPGTKTFDVLALRDSDYEKLAQPTGVAQSQVIEGLEIDLKRLFRESGAEASAHTP